jgi:hypothetical protein
MLDGAASLVPTVMVWWKRLPKVQQRMGFPYKTVWFG